MNAARIGVAGVRRAYIGVVTGQTARTDAGSTRTGVCGRADVVVIAGEGVVAVLTTQLQITGIRGADVVVVAFGGAGANALRVGAMVADGAGVAVIADESVGRMDTLTVCSATVRCADVTVVTIPVSPCDADRVYTGVIDGAGVSVAAASFASGMATTAVDITAVDRTYITVVAIECSIALA